MIQIFLPLRNSSHGYQDSPFHCWVLDWSRTLTHPNHHRASNNNWGWRPGHPLCHKVLSKMHASGPCSSLQPICERFRKWIRLQKWTYLDFSSGSTPFLLYSSAVDCSSSNCFFPSFPIILVTTLSRKSKWVRSPPLGLFHWLWWLRCKACLPRYQWPPCTHAGTHVGGATAFPSSAFSDFFYGRTGQAKFWYPKCHMIQSARYSFIKRIALYFFKRCSVFLVKHPSILNDVEHLLQNLGHYVATSSLTGFSVLLTMFFQ